MCEDRGRQTVHNHEEQGAVGGVENGCYVPDAAGPAKYADILEAYSTIPGMYPITTCLRILVPPNGMKNVPTNKCQL